MKKLFFIIPLSLVAIYGFTLNFDYYSLYFSDANYSGNLPFKMALFFILSELVLWAFSSNKNIISISLKYGLVIFSIFATLSSQFTSTSEKETESNKIVFEKIDHSSTIDHYLNQILIQDNRINQIFNQRGDDFLFTKTDDSLLKAESEKLKYEKLLSELQNKNETEIKEVYTVSSIYGWFAVELPRIAQSGLNEEFVRVMFQLFSSLILAAMSPVCISLIRNFKPDNKKPHKKSKHKKIVFPKIELPVLKFPRFKKIPEPEPPPEPMKKTSASNIVKMILSGDNGLLSPETTYEEFLAHPDREKKKLIYSIEDCKIIYDFIVSNALEHKNKDKIMEVWSGEN